MRSTAMVNQHYFYGVDGDCGPFFLKFSSYFPSNAKLGVNGPEYPKRQLAKAGIGYVALDNGFLCCEDPPRLQEMAEGLGEQQIEALLRKWLGLLPHPFTAQDEAAGYRSSSGGASCARRSAASAPG